MAILKTCWRWTHRIFWYTLAGLIIALAIAISLVRIFIPDVKLYRTQIENVASTFLAQEVRIESMDARLAGVTPLIIFKGVRMLDESGKREIIQFEEARLGLDWWHSLKERKVIPKSLTLYGVKLGITRRKDRTLVLQGLNVAKLEQQINVAPETIDTESNELARWLFQRSTLVLKNSTVVWYDAMRGNKTIRFDDVNFDILNDGERHQFTGTVSLPQNMGRYLAVAFDFKGNILDPTMWQGHFYTHGNSLQIGNWGIKPEILHTTLEDGVLDVELWGEWEAGSVTALTTDVKTNTFRLHVGEQQKPLNIKLVSGLFDWRKQTNGWQLNASRLRYLGQSELWPESKVHVVYHKDENQSGNIDAYSSYMRVDDVAHLVRDLQVADKSSIQLLEKLSPKGELSDLHVKYRLDAKPENDIVLSTRINGLSVQAYKNFPGFDGLDGVLWTDQNHGTIELDDHALQMELPTLFRKPFDLTRLAGTVQWWHAFDAWHLSAPEVALATEDIQTDFGLHVSIPDDSTSPFLDLQVHFANGNAQHTSRYLPVSIMAPELVNWIDHGIVNGHVNEGGALFHGRLHDFPFTQKPGTFTVNFRANDVLLNYRKDWPTIIANEAEATFTGKGLLITASKGTLFNSQLQDARVSIEQFALPVLTVNGKISAKTDDMVRFLVESPIAPAARSFYSQSQISGETTGQLDLAIPLSIKAEKATPINYKGYVHLNDSQLQAWDQRLVVNKISGRLNFSPRGVFADKLIGRFTGQPALFSVATRTAGQHQIIDLNMQGTLAAAALPANLQLGGLEKRIRGKTRWQGVLSFGSEDPKYPGSVSLHVNSRLEGISFDFPPPLKKSAQDAQDFRLNMLFAGEQGMPLDMKLGDTLNAALLLNAAPDRPMQIDKGVIQFSSQPAVLPKEKQLVIRGSIPLFPIDEWHEIRTQLTANANMMGLDKIGLPVILDLDALKIVTIEDAPEAEVEDPRKASLLNGEIRDLTYDDMHLGHLTIKTSRHPDGIRFDEIKINASHMDLSGEGSWLLRQGNQHTNMLLTINSDDVGSMITQLGYKGVIKHGTGRAILQVNWPDAPNRFDFAKLNGTLGSVILDGTISDVEPGAGRLLGLMSLTELPRRLLLDFSELKQGLNFKQIVAQLDIVDGDSFTENLHIISPIALIDIDGRTGLAKRDYDLDVSVAPNVSTTLPVISWLAWGGQIGALTFLIDQLFGDEFNESIATQYRVSGSWEHPEIKKIPRPKQPVKEKDQ